MTRDGHDRGKEVSSLFVSLFVDALVAEEKVEVEKERKGE